MASPNIYTAGIGGTSGPSLVTVGPLYSPGSIWYVHSGTGADAASPRGKERNRPLATLAQAYTSASQGDTIVILSGHAETLTSAQTLGKAGLTIIGEGSGSTRPRFTLGAAADLWSVTAAGVRISNIFFVESAFAATNARLYCQAANITIDNCYFECKTLLDIAVRTGAIATITITDTTFISTAASFGDQPYSALLLDGATSDVALDTVVFNGATRGWSDYAWSTNGALSRLRGENVDLLGDADVNIATTGSYGYLHIRNATGNARVVWAA